MNYQSMVTYRIFLFYSLISIILLSSSCKRFVSDIEGPNEQVKNAEVFKNSQTANAAILGMYANLLGQSNGFSRGNDVGLLALAGLSSDELHNSGNQANSPQLQSFEQNNLQPENPLVLSLWVSMYKTIYMANAAIEGLDASTGVLGSAKNTLKGEAFFLRAFAYFYLVNLYGDVPLALSTDYTVNSSLSRAATDGVYDQITTDLIKAQEMLPEDYSSFQNERVRINKYGATALLARVYLYRKNWPAAEIQASVVLSKSMYGLSNSPSEVFLKNSKEAIWQLQPNDNPDKTKGYTLEGLYFSLAYAPVTNVLKSEIGEALESNDLRKNEWVSKFDFGGQSLYRPTKYRVSEYDAPLSEYSMMLRLAEQYLIRSEARAMQGKTALAIEDLDAIRNRAGLTLIQVTNPGISKDSLLVLIEQERKVELFTEWGHRWFDLKRTGRAIPVLGALKSGFTANDLLYPIPQSERNKNNKLTQNSGY